MEIFEYVNVRKHVQTIAKYSEHVREMWNIAVCAVGGLTRTSIALSGMPMSSGGLLETSRKALAEQGAERGAAGDGAKGHLI